MTAVLRTDIIKELQKLKKALDFRKLIMESHLSSIQKVMIKDLDGTFEKLDITLDNVLGDLDSGYAMNCKEIKENTEEIENIKQNLRIMWDALITCPPNEY